MHWHRRDVDRGLLVAAATLILRTGEARLLQYGDEWGDGEGSVLSEHMAVIAGCALQEGQAVRLDFVHMHLDGVGCSCSVSWRGSRARAGR